MLRNTGNHQTGVYSEMQKYVDIKYPEQLGQSIIPNVNQTLV